MDNLLDKIGSSSLAGRIMPVLEKMRIANFVRRIFYKCYAIHPTVAMKESRKYFESHKNDILMMKEWFADEKSQNIWQQMIELRQTMNYKLHPGMELPQYFVEDIIHYEENEVFVDCGGYDGMTSIEFINHVKETGGYKRVIIFEPDKSNLDICKNNVLGMKDVHVIPKGVWDKTTKIGFCAMGSQNSVVIEQQEVTDFGLEKEMIEVVALDDIEECSDATFIKMDLEGSEMKALKGAENIIKKNKPKLAICIYHSDEDMLQIVKYIHTLVPEYRLYVRQHSAACIETVLYAVLR